MSQNISFVRAVWLLLAYDSSSVIQALRNSSFHMWWMIRLEMEIMAGDFGFSVDLVSSVDPFLMTNMSRNGIVLSVSTSLVNCVVGHRMLM